MNVFCIFFISSTIKNPVIFVGFLIFSSFCNLTEFLIFCSECECNEDGSVDERCDDEGKCSCKSNVIGDKCSKCQSDHYDYPRCEGKEKYPGFGQIIFKFFFSL